MVSLGIIKRAVNRIFEALIPSVRTHLIGQIVSYDADTNTATIQPVTKALRLRDVNAMTTVQLPPLADVPVTQYGSGTLWCTVPPAAGSYGILHISDREIETWMSNGGINDPMSVRTHNLSDAIFEMAVVPLKVDGDNGAFETAVKTDRIGFRTRDGAAELVLLADGSVEVTTDGQPITMTDGTSTVTVDGAGVITLDNGSHTLVVDGAEVKAGAGSDFVAMSIPTDANFDLINTIITNWVPTPQDGGAALKTAWTAAWAAAVQATASADLKAE